MAIVYKDGHFRSYRPVNEALETLKKELAELPAKQRAAVEEIVKQYGLKGKSPIADIAEKCQWDPTTGPPIPIRQWVNDPYYLGETAHTLFPKLKEDMVELFEGNYYECILTGCVDQDAIVMCSDGSMPRLGDLIGRKTSVVTVDEDRGVGHADSTEGVDSGVRQVLELTLTSGMRVRLTPDHRVLTTRGWVPAAHLKDSDWVLRPRSVTYTPSMTNLRDEEVKLLAYWVTDGSSSATRARYCNGRIETVREVITSLRHLGYSSTTLEPYEKNGAWEVHVARLATGGFRDWLERHKLLGVGSSAREVPDAICRAPLAQVALFLNRVWAAEGTVSVTSAPRFQLGMKSERFIRQVQLLLLRWGIQSRIYRTTSRRHGTECVTWLLAVTGAENLRAFLREIGPIFSKERECEALAALLHDKKANTNVDLVPLSWGEANEELRRSGVVRKAGNPWWKLAAQKSRHLSRDTHQALMQSFPQTTETLDVYPESVFYDRIKSLVPVETRIPVADIGVPGPMRFTANGITVHNSIGWGKDYFATTALVRVLYELLCLKNPTDTLGLGRGEIIHIVPISHLKEAAQRVVFEGVLRKLVLAPFFKGRFEPTKEEIRFPGKNIVITGGGSSDNSALGLNVWAALVDEMNFMKTKKGGVSAAGQNSRYDKGQGIYDTIQRRIKSRYAGQGLKGMLFLVSSKRSMSDFTERRILEAMKDNDAGVFVRDYSTWDVRPNAFHGQKWFTGAVSPREGRTRIIGEKSTVKPDDIKKDEIPFTFPEQYYKEFLNDPEGATRDIAGIAMESFKPFFSNRQAIDDMMKKDRPHPFHVYDWNTTRNLTIIWKNLMLPDVHGDPVPRCCPHAPRHVHADMSKNQDATGICVGHHAGGVPVMRRDPETGEEKQEEAPVIHIDFVLKVVPPYAGEIDHQSVRSLIYELIAGGLPIRSASMDKWMGLPNLQMLQKHGLKTAEISTQRTLDPYLAARSALYERRVESPIYPALAKELRELELTEDGKKVDHPKTGCFTGDTRVRLLDGRSLSFEQLVAEFGDGRPFYTYTIRDGAVSVGVARNPRLTARDAEIVCVTLDSGAKIRCTPDHRFMLRDGSYREAKDLRPNDSLMPLYTKISDRRKHDMHGYELYACPADGKWHFTHHMVGRWKYSDKGYTGNQFGNGIIHHERGKLNNDPDALKWVADSREHALEHRDDMLRRRADPEFEAKRLAGLAAYNDDPLNKKAASERFKSTLSRPDVFEKTQTARAATGRITGPRNLTAYNKSPEHRAVAGAIGRRTIYAALEAKKAQWRTDITIERIIELRRDGLTLNEIAARFGCCRSVVERRIRAARSSGVEIPAPVRRPKIAPNNHKVVSVEPAGRADVYDLTVAETENFALEAGVFVHNSKDLADAWAAVIYYITQNARPTGSLAPSRGVSETARNDMAGPRPTGDGNFRWPDEPDTDVEADAEGLPSWIIS